MPDTKHLNWGESTSEGLNFSWQDIVGRSKSLAKMRWIAIGCQMVCVWPGLKLGLLTEPFLLQYAAVVAILALFNFVFEPIFKFFKVNGENGILIQLIVDLAALGLLLFITKGCANPMFALVYLHAAIGPLLLTKRRSRLFLVATCLVLMVVCLTSESMVHGPDGLILPNWVLFSTEISVVCLVWQLTTWMSKYLKDLRANLQHLEHQKLRIDNLRAMGVMASSFSHELATPLNTIKVRLDRMKRQFAKISNNDDLVSASQAVEQCEMVLKKFFGAELEPINIQFDRVLIFDLIESACKKWEESQVENDFKLNIVVKEGARNIYCFIPSHLLVRSILDLLDNAKEASEVSSEVVQITMYTKGRNAVIEIADRGPGVLPEIKNRLGTPFVSGKEHGSGLGLFSAYSLAEALGGSLELFDRPGGGTIVALIVPMKGQGD